MKTKNNTRYALHTDEKWGLVQFTAILFAMTAGKRFNGRVVRAKTGASSRPVGLPFGPLPFNLSVPFPVGLGYDPMLRNSNSFIGTVLRSANVQATGSNRAWGFSQDFTSWVWWDHILQSELRERVANQ